MVSMTSKQYAARRGVSRQAVAKRIASGTLGASVSRDARGRVLIDADLADIEWARNADPSREQATSAGAALSTGSASAEAGPNFLAAKARRETALATMAEIELKRRSGELVLASDVVREWSALLSSARTQLLGLPTRLCGEIPEMKGRGFAIATKVIRDVLENLANENTNEEGEAT